MATRYVQTDFAKITDGIRAQYRIKSQAAGVELIPLAKGEKPAAKTAAKKASKKKKATKKTKAKAKP